MMSHARMTKALALVAALAVSPLLAPAAAEAQGAEPVGVWSTQAGKARVRIAKCGAALCGTLVGLAEPTDPETGKPKTDKNNQDAGKRNRPLIGTAIVLGMKPTGNGTWEGQVYNAEDGKTYTGFLNYTGGNTLKLQGCVARVLCKSQTWSKN